MSEFDYRVQSKAATTITVEERVCDRDIRLMNERALADHVSVQEGVV